MDIDINLIKHYFEQIARKLEEHILSPIRTEVSVQPSVVHPCEVVVTVRIYDCENIDGSFKECVQSAFELAGDRLLYQRSNCFTSIKLNVMLYEKEPQFEIPFNSWGFGGYLSDRFMPPLSFEIKEEEVMYSVPEVKEIIHSTSKKKGELFTVKWADNTETTVKRMDGDTSDDYIAFMYCVSIKMFGSKGGCRQYIKDKKNVFSERVAKRSEEIRNRKLQKVAEDKAKRSVPYVGGLRVPALASSDMFKKNTSGGGDK